MLYYLLWWIDVKDIQCGGDEEAQVWIVFPHSRQGSEVASDRGEGQGDEGGKVAGCQHHSFIQVSPDIYTKLDSAAPCWLSLPVLTLPLLCFLDPMFPLFYLILSFASSFITATPFCETLMNAWLIKVLLIELLNERLSDWLEIKWEGFMITRNKLPLAYFAHSPLINGRIVHAAKADFWRVTSLDT